MDNATLDILNNRIDVIENIFFKGNKSSTDPITIVTKLTSIQDCLQHIETDIPSTVRCAELIENLRPYILQKRASLHHMEEKVESLMAKREQLLMSVQDLQAVEIGAEIVNSDAFRDIDSLRPKLEFLDLLFEPIIAETNRQSREIDELLDLYEKAMRVISDLALNLQNRILRLSN